MTTKDFLLTIYLILRITISCQNSTTSQFVSTVTQTNTLQINSTLSTTSNQFSLNQTSSMRNDTITPSSIMRNDTITTFPSNMTIISSNRTTTNETMTPFPSNRTTTNETMTPFPSNRTTTNETMTPFPSNRTTTNDITSPTTSNSTPQTTTTNYLLPSTTPQTTFAAASVTDVPARSGEYSSKIQMECRFIDEAFFPEYNDKTSQKYKDYTRSVYNRMREKLLLEFIRLIEIIFLSLRHGSVVADMQFVMATNSSLSNDALTNSVKTATNTAYPNVIINSFTVIQSPTLVTNTSQTTTSLTTTTTPQRTIVSSMVTDVPARFGEYSCIIQMECRFIDEIFYDAYYDKSHQKYKDYTRSVYNRMREKLLLLLIRLINIEFSNLRSGSVVADMKLIMAATSSLSNDALTTFVKNATIQAYPTAIINNFTVVQPPTLVTMTTSTPNTFLGWGIFLIVLGSIIIITAVILLIIFGIRYVKSRSSDLTPYPQETPSDKKGILLNNSRVYDSL